MTGKTTDDWGNIAYTNEQALRFVRFEPTSKLVKSRDNEELQLALLMFYDQRNSSPTGLIFEVDQQIEFNGKKYTIVLNDQEHDESGLHHQEVGLV